ncbi:MAG: hypothetical protein AAF689_16570 [Pseudomonadota bacterium]
MFQSLRTELREYWRARKQFIQITNFGFLVIMAMVAAHYFLGWGENEVTSTFDRMAPTFRWLMPLAYVFSLVNDYRAYKRSRNGGEQK